jgi:deferrochelatase/peroxidase EfeB
MPLYNRSIQASDDEILGDLQGNVLRGFRNIRNTYLFVRFAPDGAAARQWLRATCLANGCPFPVTTATAYAQSVAAAPTDAAGQTHVNVFLTASGLTKLGVGPNVVSRMDPAFQRGMRAAATARRLGDPPPTDWEVPYQQPWDAVVLVASDAATQATVEAALGNAATSATVVAAHHLERGNVLDQNGAPVPGANSGPRYEIFGYQDNLSVLMFQSEHADRVGIAPTDTPAWDPRRDVSMAIVRDPLSGSNSAYGSYFVFRKYHQDRQGFDRRVSEISQTLAGPKGGRYLNQLYASKVMGANASDAYAIYAAGTPTPAAVHDLVRQHIMGRSATGATANIPASPVGTPPPANHAFNYGNDRDGGRCPFSAHARVMNRRGESGDRSLENPLLAMGERCAQDATGAGFTSEAAARAADPRFPLEREKCLARRGMPYGEAGQPDSGLLFLSAQNSIENQFEFLQESLANTAAKDPNSEPTPMVDNVIGRSQPVVDGPGWGPGNDRYQRYTSTIATDYSIRDEVQFRGGEYLFAPSRTGLVALTGGQS